MRVMVKPKRYAKRLMSCPWLTYLIFCGLPLFFSNFINPHWLCLLNLLMTLILWLDPPLSNSVLSLRIWMKRLFFKLNYDFFMSNYILYGLSLEWFLKWTMKFWSFFILHLKVFKFIKLCFRLDWLYDNSFNWHVVNLRPLFRLTCKPHLHT